MARRRRRRKPLGSRVGDISIQLNEILEGVSDEVKLSAMKAIDNVGQEAAQKLQNTSPRKTGSYAAGWTYSQTPTGGVVHNATDYQLTHLLEFDHVISNGRGTYGRSTPQVHIKPGEEWAKTAVIQEIERVINDSI